MHICSFDSAQNIKIMLISKCQVHCIVCIVYCIFWQVTTCPSCIWEIWSSVCCSRHSLNLRLLQRAYNNCKTLWISATAEWLYKSIYYYIIPMIKISIDCYVIKDQTLQFISEASQTGLQSGLVEEGVRLKFKTVILLTCSVDFLKPSHRLIWIVVNVHL